ncbi:FecR domain-containing protein [Rapidithrix thailandica]|uniref:FecR domain-containing protein n=1 Tax=Rapidithrix thailandica TaxID=413964 RepID=A0AAW9S844_9BACT
MKITPELLHKYATGACTEEELLRIEAWLEDQDTAYELPENEDLPLHKQQIWQAIHTKVSPAVSGKVGPSHSFRFPQRIWAVAASIAVLIGIAGVFLYTTSQKKNIHYKCYYTQKGQKLKITLPDHSRVYLNAGSELKVPEYFSDTARVVSLKGEAYFEVHKDPQRPFTIQSPDSRTTILGTAFNLRAYPREATVLTVTEGKVRFSSRKTPENYILLTANEQGKIGPETKLCKTNIDASPYTAWKENRIVFTNMKFAEMLAELERWYNVNIQVEKPGILQQRYRGSFENPSLNVLLEDLGFVMKFNYRMASDTVFIY